ncbi:nitroreductase family protein [Marispirochaeta sp.]|jgi:nitroreductase|uniref:nitroreductase family protein n=1 Tax=Marispirochaeta sp. TaxID=2038653 RepID=UPI0029C7CB44|nr:nitroreductase family protein [Marispirochaeta sp.]
MKLTQLVRTNRSYRRFNETEPVPETLMTEMVDLGRICPSGANRQPLKYMVISDPAAKEKIFPLLSWAAYLQEWKGPAKGERPTGYIIILGDSEISKDPSVDLGISAQTMLLRAAEEGYGGCMIASVKKESLRQVLEIPDDLDVLLVIALGKPAEEVILEEKSPEGTIQYYRDSKDRHHVPKRPLKEVLLKK